MAKTTTLTIEFSEDELEVLQYALKHYQKSCRQGYRVFKDIDNEYSTSCKISLQSIQKVDAKIKDQLKEQKGEQNGKRKRNAYNQKSSS